MNTLIVGVDSDIGNAIYNNVPNAICTSRHENQHAFLDIEMPQATWPTFTNIDSLYYCIGIAGRGRSSEKVMNVNATRSIECLDKYANSMNNNGTVYVLSSIAGSLQFNIPGNVFYKMSKCALNMGVKELADKYPSIKWVLIHPGFVDTKMTRGLALKNAISPDQSAKGILALKAQNNFQFLNVDGSVIPL